MTEARVLELIEAYGPEPGAWPDAEREAATALLRRSPDTFADALEDARLLDAALAGMPEPDIPAGLAERIVASAPTSVERPSFLSLIKSKLSIGGSILPSASALASSALGLIIGYGALGTTQIASVDSAEQAVYAAFDADYGDFDIGDLN